MDAAEALRILDGMLAQAPDCGGEITVPHGDLADAYDALVKLVD